MLSVDGFLERFSVEDISAQFVAVSLKKIELFWLCITIYILLPENSYPGIKQTNKLHYAN